MRLYSLTGAGAVDDPAFGHFGPAADGGFDFPGPLSDRLHGVAIGGRRQWEDAMERGRRLILEEQARRADPATLLAAVETLVARSEAPPAPARAKGGSKP